MRKSFFSIAGLVVVLASVSMFLCSAAVCAETAKKFAYNRSDTMEVVYVWDESGKYLTPELKYEFKRNADNTIAEKKAYRWNVLGYTWEPYYRMTFTQNENQYGIEFARWNEMTEDFSLNPQKTVYDMDSARQVLSYTTYNWNRNNAVWEQDERVLLQEYLADIILKCIPDHE